MTTKLEVGDKAPDFELQSTTGDKLRLSDQLGKGPIVLLFYPLAWSSVCTEEMCSVRDALKEFEELNASVFGIGVDSPYAQKAWSKELGLKFPLISDFNKEVSTSYGVLHEELGGLKGVSKRSVFILDNDGKIQYKWVSEDPTRLPDIDQIKRVLAKIQKSISS